MFLAGYSTFLRHVFSEMLKFAVFKNENYFIHHRANPQ
jgi:hypothetical protein